MSATPEPRAELVQRARAERVRVVLVDHGVPIPGFADLKRDIVALLADVEREAEAALARKVREAIDAELRGNGYTLDDVRQEAAVHATCETVTLSRAIVAALEALPAEPKGPTT